MQGALYRYPHPFIEGLWIYVGQGNERDRVHRCGLVGFGLRFKKRFPGIVLPQPVREIVEVKDPIELNELETIWMFRYHTWQGYEGGMNLTFPGSTDYANFGKLQPHSTRVQHGLRAVETGLLFRIATFESRSKGGKTTFINKIGVFSPVLDNSEALRRGGKNSGLLKAAIPGYLATMGRLGGKAGGPRGSRTTNCLRWSIRRNKPCLCGNHLNTT